MSATTATSATAAVPTSWPEVLDRLEADALRLAAATSAEELEAVQAEAIRVEDLDLPSLPTPLAERARAVLRTLAEAEQAVVERIRAVRAGLDAVTADSAGAPTTARYIDQDL